MAGLNIVEKVIALEGVELLKNLTPEQLSRIASIAREVKHPPNKVVMDPATPMDALLVVVDGAVELSRDGEVLHTAKQNEVLGAWALFDDDPMPVTAKTVGQSRLLRIGRDDFYDPMSGNIKATSSNFDDLEKRYEQR